MAEANNSSTNKKSNGVVHAAGYVEKKYESPVLKWYQVKMSYEEKARFNLLTYAELLEWQKEMMEEQSGQSGSEDKSAVQGKTFWAQDEAERLNVSSNDYESFLAENNIDVSNRNSVSFDELQRQLTQKISDKPAQEEESEDDILARINAANGQGTDRCLTEEEIAALFAAAANN